MRLRNKKTGEIVTLTLSTNGEDMIIMGNDMYAHTTKLSELKDYEDHEEPELHWYIDSDGEVIGERMSSIEALTGLCSGILDDRKQIGNHFETKEEAEKAVEKLKAWKRLKDKGFRFVGWQDSVSDNNPEMALFKLNEDAWETDTCEDLDLLFSQEIEE